MSVMKICEETPMRLQYNLEGRLLARKMNKMKACVYIYYCILPTKLLIISILVLDYYDEVTQRSISVTNRKYLIQADVHENCCSIPLQLRSSFIIIFSLYNFIRKYFLIHLRNFYEFVFIFTLGLVISRAYFVSFTPIYSLNFITTRSEIILNIPQCFQHSKILRIPIRC